ncbi:MAG: hypothetical protein QGG50_03455 [Methanopyri archaeon]|jgi:hypothetical protein|nr:hypothetical protein [Methanopyri archaeon]
MALTHENQRKRTYGTVAAVVYGLFGALQVLAGLGLPIALADALLVPSDIIGGLILLLLAVVSAFGLRELFADMDVGVAFIDAGIFFSLMFAGIYLLIFGTDALQAYVLGSEDFAGWRPVDGMKPIIYLGILPLAGLLGSKNQLFTLDVPDKEDTVVGDDDT